MTADAETDCPKASGIHGLTQLQSLQNSMGIGVVSADLRAACGVIATQTPHCIGFNHGAHRLNPVKISGAATTKPYPANRLASRRIGSPS